MIAFPTLIVVSKDALSLHDKRQPVFERVDASEDRRWQSPENDLVKGLSLTTVLAFSSTAFRLLLIAMLSVVVKNNSSRRGSMPRRALGVTET